MIALQSSTNEIIKRTNLLCYGFCRVRFLKEVHNFWEKPKKKSYCQPQGSVYWGEKVLSDCVFQKHSAMGHNMEKGSKNKSTTTTIDSWTSVLDLFPGYSEIFRQVHLSCFSRLRQFCKHGDISNWVKIETCSADPGPAHDREWPPTSPRTTLHRPHGKNCYLWILGVVCLGLLVFQLVHCLRVPQ